MSMEVEVEKEGEEIRKGEVVVYRKKREAVKEVEVRRETIEDYELN